MSSKRKDNPFTSVQSQPVETNVFDLSHDVKLTMKMGSLVPATCLEVLPGDTFRIDYVNMFRFAPLIAPVMHRVKLVTEYFYIPLRILWEGWEPFITGTSDTVIEWPYVTLNADLLKSTVGDYLGLPPGDYSQNPIDVSVLPFAAYNRVYNDWYRYAPVIDKKFETVVDGDNTADWYGYVNGVPLNRAWEHDYFTSALPDTQQGAQVELPLVNQEAIPVELTDLTRQPLFVKPDGDPAAIGAGASNVTSAQTSGALTVSNSVGPARFDPNGSLTVDIQAEAATINDLREAFALQAFLERTLRGGERYIEQIWAHFNVKSSDARLQRPEFLGRSTQAMTISEVLSTAQSSNDPMTANVPVGQMAGHGISTGGGNGISYTAEEHGFIIGIVSAIPETAYQDGISRMWFRSDRYEYAWPSFASLGERPIMLKELVAHDFPVPTDLDAPFGYIPQYSEYRYHPSRVAGEFRDTLAFWTLGRIFDPSSPPALNEDFVSCRSAEGLSRIFAVQDDEEDYLFGQIINRVTVNRRLPRYGVPNLVG